MASPEIEDAVRRAREDALRPLPWPGRTDDRERRTEQLADGSTRYFLGTFYVDVAPGGLILVNRDDWLSKYSLAINGTLEVRGKFTRVRDGKEIAIENENLIRVGEMLIHRATAERHAIQRRMGDELALQSPDRPMEPHWRVDLSLRKRDQIASGAMQRMPFTPFSSVAGKIDHEAIKRLKRYAHNRLPAVGALREVEKQQYFLTDAKATTAILLYEFADGEEGHEYRKFDERHAIVQELKTSTMAEEILRSFAAMNIGAASLEELVPLDEGFHAYSFSPDAAQLDESLEKHLAALEKMEKADSDVELFVAGASYKVSIDTASEKLNVLVRDEKSRRSLMLHAAQNRERALFAGEPLGTTVQDYTFSLDIPWERIHSAEP